MNAWEFVKRLAAILFGVVLFVGGVLKLMDPVGSTLVMDSYLGFIGLSFMRFASHALAMAFNFAECIIGASMVAGVWTRFIRWVSLALMGFFTILTLALLIANPHMDCGCFGEAVHLTHLQSFLKNIVLLALWAVAFLPLRKEVKVSSRRMASVSLVICAVIVFGVIMNHHLPLVDLTDLRTGTEIAEGRIPLLGEDDNYYDDILYSGDMVVVSIYDPSSISARDITRISRVGVSADMAGMKCVVLSAGPSELADFTSDRKTLLSLNRSNGGVTYIHDGQIVKKWPIGVVTADRLEEASAQDPIELIQHESSKGSLQVCIGTVLALLVLLI